MHKKSLFSVLCFFVFVQLSAQQYAGPDKTICPGKSVMIGGVGSGQLCYKWTSSDGSFTSEDANPTVSPTETTTYTVEVTKEDLSDIRTDAVTVEVKGIESLSVTQKDDVCCWKRGDPVSLSQFTIVTVPPGLEKEVTLSPMSAPGGFFGASGSPTITFDYGCGEEDKTSEIQIPVVDEDYSISIANQEWSIEIDKMKNLMTGISNKMKNTIRIPGIGCEPGGGISFNTPGSAFSFGKICCSDTPDKCIRDNFQLTGLDISASVGVQCNVPFPPMPLVFDITFGGGLSAGLSYTPISASCEGDKQCAGLSFTGSLNGGLSTKKLAEEVISAKGVLIVGISPKELPKYCIPGGFSTDFSLCAQIDAEVSVTFVTFYTKKATFNLLSKRCL
ncbi:MAG: hypothetical protein IPM98_06200 [Lewinellaceae bacterium]|nr:hypothetical protein [Lewinellaceae bacterium]